MTSEALLARMQDSTVKLPELAIIIKADAHGSVEAIRSSIENIKTTKNNNHETTKL